MAIKQKDFVSKELRERLANAIIEDNKRYRKNVIDPIFYKKPFIQSAAFYCLVVITTMIAAGFFYYG